MQIELYLDDLLIGRGDVDIVDNVKRMAVGSFEAEAGYERDAHAAEIDGAENRSAWKLSFIVQTADGEPVGCKSVLIVDASASGGARIVALNGVDQTAYEKFFGENLDAKQRRQAPAEGSQVDTLYIYAGDGGAMAYTLDASGANLPLEYAPWEFEGEVATNGSTFKAGADRAALEKVRKTGFAVSVFSITIEDGGSP